MIILIDNPELMRATIGVFGRLPTEFNCVAWLQLSTSPSPLAATVRRGMNAESEPFGWIFHYNKKAYSNELGAMLRPKLDEFNTNPVFITVHYAIRN